MANKGFAYGMSAAVARKIESKRDKNQEDEVQSWIEAITGNSFDPAKSFEDNLRDGTVLLHLANKLKPGYVKKINSSTMPFKLMENIGLFLTFCEQYGVPKSDLFQTVALYEASNIPQVTATLFALGRVCHMKPMWDNNSSEYKGWPGLGPKPSQENVREFDEATIAEGKKIIGLQSGTNKLASQSGSSFGGRRQINVEEGPRS